jgi:hypothetical protein
MKKTIASLALFALSGAASATTLPSTYFTLQSSTDFIVNETFNTSTGTGYYDVTNNLSSSVTFFAVSAYNAYDAATTRKASTTAGQSHFNAQTVTESEWTYLNPYSLGFDLSYAELFGDFDSVFGTEDNVANVYFEVDGNGIVSGETTGTQFSYSALVPASNWIAVTGFGNAYSGSATLPTTSSPSAVPVPAAALLFAPAMVGFAALRRKAKKAA